MTTTTISKGERKTGRLCNLRMCKNRKVDGSEFADINNFFFGSRHLKKVNLMDSPWSSGHFPSDNIMSNVMTKNLWNLSPLLLTPYFLSSLTRTHSLRGISVSAVCLSVNPILFSRLSLSPTIVFECLHQPIYSVSHRHFFPTSHKFTPNNLIPMIPCPFF